MTYAPFKMMPNAAIPDDIAPSIADGGSIHPTPFEQKNAILTNAALQAEAGFVRMENGDYLVAMTCPMPGVTKAMIDWWFWWHPQENVRYRMWYPGEHERNGYGRKDAAYFNVPDMPAFQPNTQYPVERIGKQKMPLVIDFLTAEQFGFDSADMAKGNIAAIVCGHVGAYHNLVQHTEMAHIFFQREDGLFLVSRFWLGKRLKNPLIRHCMLTDDTAGGMAAHCCVEYRNLSRLLPTLYRKNVICGE